MTLELTAVGGYNEVGRQSTALKCNDDAIIIDLGLHLEHYIKYTEDEEEDITTTSSRGLRKAGAVPDWTSIKDWKNDVRAIILTHAHLDHVGAVPYIAPFFDCPIYGSPFTIALLKQLIDDKDIDVPNELIPVRGSVTVSDNFTVEFIPTTHSTVDAMMLAIHTPDGIVYCDNDYKLDNHPTIGEPVDMKNLEHLQGKVVAHVAECLYAPEQATTPSESVARMMLQEVLLDHDFRGRAVFVSTFSSHIARLNSIMEIGKAMGRKVVFFGRSMAKYLSAAEEAGILKLPKHVEILKYGAQIKRFFKKQKDLSPFLCVCTGHMGEPKAALSKILDGKYPFKFKPEDVVVLSSRVIPVPNIIANREHLMKKLKSQKLRVFDGVHVSGHASKEDIRLLLQTIKPKKVIPNHGIPKMTEAFIDIAREEGYKSQDILNLREGDRVTLVD